MKAIENLVVNLLQSLRELYGKPLRINSGYRSPELNKQVGGVPTSQHSKGEAADTAGKQYPVKTAEISFNKEQKEQLIVNELSGSEVTIQKKDSILIIEEEATKDDVTKDNRLLPLWVWWLPALSPPYTTNL